MINKTTTKLFRYAYISLIVLLTIIVICKNYPKNSLATYFELLFPFYFGAYITYSYFFKDVMIVCPYEAKKNDKIFRFFLLMAGLCLVYLSMKRW